MRGLYKKSQKQNICCICGFKKCTEATDHSYMSLQQLKNKVESAKIPNQVIEALKQKADTFYSQLKYKVNMAIEGDHKRLQEHLNRYYFWHLKQQGLSFGDICQIGNGCYDKLPSKRVIRVLNSIESNRKMSLKQDALQEIAGLKKQLQKSFEMQPINKQLQKLKSILPYSRSFSLAIPELKLKKSTSDMSNPEDTQEQFSSCYMWKNFQVTARTKILELNNKNITDEQLLKEMKKLSSFKNVQQFEIRNNRITPLSCRLIATNMQHARSIDIRGNKVGDQGVLCIVKGMPNLKSLMISQTGCTSVSLKSITSSLSFLQKLWCEYNKIDGQTAYQVSNMPTLRILSFIGCNIEKEMVEKIKKLFHPKGYVSI